MVGAPRMGGARSSSADDTGGDAPATSDKSSLEIEPINEGPPVATKGEVGVEDTAAKEGDVELRDRRPGGVGVGWIRAGGYRKGRGEGGGRGGEGRGGG